MSNITKNKIKQQVNRSAAAYGDISVLQFTMTCGSTGVFTDSDDATVLAVGDIIRLGIIPAGTILYDALIIVSNVAQAASTADVGFLYTDGVDDSDYPQDADYFGAAHAMDAQARIAADNLAVVPATLSKDAYLVLTWGGANNDEASRVDVLVTCRIQGQP